MVTNDLSVSEESRRKGSKGSGPHNIFVQRSDQAVSMSLQQSE